MVKRSLKESSVFGVYNLTEICGVPASQVNAWVRSGILVAYRVSRRIEGIRVTRQTLIQFMKLNGMEDRLPLIGESCESERR